MVMTNVGNFVFNPWSIPPLVTSLYFLVLGLFILLKKSRLLSNLFFFLFCLVTFWWQFSWFILFNTSDPVTASVLVKVGYTGINFLGATLLGFVVEYFEYRKLRPYVAVVFLAALALLVPLWLTDLYIAGFYRFFWGYYPKAGPVHFVHLVHQLLLCSVPIIVLLFAAIFRFRGNPLKKKQAVYFFVAMAIYVLAAPDYLVNWGLEFYPAGVLFIAFAATIIALAIIRYRAFEIETVVHRTALWIITSASVFIPLVTLFVLADPVFRRIPPLALGLVLSAVFLALIRFYNFIQPKIDHAFRRRRYDSFKVLGELAVRLGGELDLDAIVSKLVAELKNGLFIRNGVLLLKASDDRGYCESSSFGYGEKPGEVPRKKNAVSLAPDHLLIDWFQSSGISLEKQRLENDPALERIREDALKLFHGAALEVLVPVYIHGRINALIGLGKKENLRPYASMDITVLESVGKQIGVLFENALRHREIVRRKQDQERLRSEMAIAERIQTALIPEPPPRIPGYEIAARMVPAEEVGGDYYDILTDRDNRLWLAVGDVTGHGVTPGLIMMMAQCALSTTVRQNSLTPAQAMTSVNRLLYDNVRNRLREPFFMSMQLVSFTEKGSGKLASAGHPSALLFRKSTGVIEAVRTPGLLLAMEPELDGNVEDREFPFESGDILCLHTDGITEAHDVEKELSLFGEERLTSIIREHAHGSLPDMRDIIFSEARRHCGARQTDDMTLVLLRKT